MFRSENDRTDLPIDFRFPAFLLKASEDPEVSLGSFASGARVGPGARLPRLPALYAQKRKWRLPRAAEPEDYMEPQADGDAVWRRNYSTLPQHSDKDNDVMEDQARRGLVIALTEEEARARFPKLAIASLGTNRKDKASGVISASSIRWNQRQ